MACKLVNAAESRPVFLEVVEVEYFEDTPRVEREVDHRLALVIAARLDECAVEHEKEGVDAGS